MRYFRCTRDVSPSFLIGKIYRETKAPALKPDDLIKLWPALSKEEIPYLTWLVVPEIDFQGNIWFRAHEVEEITDTLELVELRLKGEI